MNLADRASQAMEDLIELRPVRWAAELFTASPDAKLHQTLARLTLRNAVPFWWDRNCCDLVLMASRTLPEWTVRPELFPVSSGFFRFAKPLEYSNAFEGIAAMAWVRVDEFVQLSTFCDGDHGLFLGGLVTIKLSEQAVASVKAVRTATGIEMPSEDQAWMCVLGSALLFIEQNIVVSTPERLDRPARKRLEKAALNISHVNVIRLRRIRRDASGDASTAVDWQFRWMVRGHWRQQWFPGDSSHRPIWILPHIKGPEGKPFKVPNQSVFAVVR